MKHFIKFIAKIIITKNRLWQPLRMQLTHSLDQKQLDIQVRNPISRMKREQTNLFFFFLSQ